jgi:hypothetical protein
MDLPPSPDSGYYGWGRYRRYAALALGRMSIRPLQRADPTGQRSGGRRRRS